MEGAAAQTPPPPSSASAPSSAPRASDAERDAVAARLREEYVAGRLSHDTFLHRMSAVLEAKRQADLPPLLADLPARQAPGPAGPRAVLGWLRGAWSRMAGPADGRRPALGRRSSPRPQPGGRRLTMGMLVAADGGGALSLSFPRGEGETFSIGRDASCDLAIADMTVSRRHAALERTPGGWLLVDLGSTNGTRVNGWRVRGKVEVRAGDLVSFGNVEAVFGAGGDSLPSPAA